MDPHLETLTPAEKALAVAADMQYVETRRQMDRKKAEKMEELGLVERND